MSKVEVERFVKEINADSSVHEEVNSLVGNVEKLVAWAKAKGFDFSADEYTAFIEEHKATLDEEDLDKIAGGAAPSITVGPSPIIGVKTVTEVVTTVEATVQAEVTATVVVT